MPGLTGRASRPPRSLAPAASRRTELAAALGVALLLAHLLFAQLTLLLTVAFLALGRASRWRRPWLAVPAFAGLVWILGIGPGAAVAGFTAGPGRIWAYLAAAGHRPGQLLHLLAGYSGAGQWLPRQLPVALVAAAAEAGFLGWLTQPGSSGGWPPGYRPGLIVAVRSRLSAAALAAGGAVTRDGCGVGLEVSSGRLAGISWAEAAGGVLAVGTDAGTGAGLVAELGLPVAAAAIRRRKAVLVIDLSGSARVTASLTAACGIAAAPLSVSAAATATRYEPFCDRRASQVARLLAEMIDWAGTSGAQRKAAEQYLSAALAVLAADPSAGQDTLADLVSVLRPADLRVRAALVRADDPRRDALGQQAATAAGLLEADPEAAAALAAQLPLLRASQLGRSLRAPARGAAGGPAAVPGPHAVAPAAAAAAIRLGPAVRDRQVVLFSLDRARHGPAAAMVARLVLADLMTVLGRLRARDLCGDSLVWVNGIESVSRPSLASLLALGPATGTAVLLTTTRTEAAVSLAPAARIILAAGPVSADLAGLLAGLAVPAAGSAVGSASGSALGSAARSAAAAGSRRAGGTGAGEGSSLRNEEWCRPLADLLVRQPERGFALIARGSRPRVLPDCRMIPARLECGP